MVIAVCMLGLISIISSLILALFFHLNGWQLFIPSILLSCFTAYSFWYKMGYNNFGERTKRELPLTSICVGFLFGFCLTAPVTALINYFLD